MVHLSEWQYRFRVFARKELNYTPLVYTAAFSESLGLKVW